MSKNSYISVSGVEYNKAEALTISSTQEVGTKVPITFSFLYSPSTTTFSNNLLSPTIFTFDNGDYHIIEYTISAWNPNSSPGSNIGNALVIEGFAFMDTEGSSNIALSSDLYNMSGVDFISDNTDVGTDVSLTTNLGSISGTPFSLNGGGGNSSVMLIPKVVNGTTVEVIIRPLKSGYRVKGLVTLS